MKEIALPSHIFTHSSGTGPVNFDTAVAHAKAARQNANKILSAALYVEREIEAIIGRYLYPGPEVPEQQHFVARHILGSNALTFAVKRRLIMALVNEKRWLQGAAKASFEEHLKKVQSFRNAFTHGNVIEKDHRTVLEYFEGTLQERDLTDAYWDEIVLAFEVVSEHIEAVKSALGVLGQSSNTAAK